MITLIAAFMMMLAVNENSDPIICQENPRTHASIHWSEKSRIVSPNRTKYIEVNPILTGDENRSPVELKTCSSQFAAPVLLLTRSANIHWSSDSSKLLVIDQPGANSHIVRLYNIRDSDDVLAVNEIYGLNDHIRNLVMSEIPSGGRIEFFRPHFKSWNGSNLVLSIRGTYSFGGRGPMTSFCFDTMIDSRGAIPRANTMGNARSADRCLS